MNTIQYQNIITNSLKFRMYMLSKLPSVFFWGIRVEKLQDDLCAIKIPYRYTTKNPYGSIYFSALMGAAELSTGLLIDMHTRSVGNVSMLVTHVEANFIKKAKTEIIFTCAQGKEILIEIDKLKNSGDKTEITLETQGININGEAVMNAKVHWSLKKK